MSFYRETYLKSDHWKNLRLQKLAEADGKCLRCGQRSLQNDVHHLQYKNLYDVETLDLVVLCRACHSIVHQKLDEVAALIKNGTPASVATWRSFLETWGDHPNNHKELRAHIIRLRKAGKVQRFYKKKQGVPITLEFSKGIYTHYLRLAHREGKSIIEWIEHTLRKATLR